MTQAALTVSEICLDADATFRGAPRANGAQTTFLMTTLTTAGHPHTPSYITQGLPSCLVTVSARAYGSEGLGFGSLRARPTVALGNASDPVYAD